MITRLKQIPLFIGMIALSLVPFVSTAQTFEGGGAQKKTPENIKCPDGITRSHCVDHEWHGCSDDIGC
ncbi:hypothetical protein [Algoriphagus boritolerans]|uniref:Uncharacterized protein n=2 Tax=Algoriphagus TaxID=246875 RepID=A0A1H5VZN5_9BACT|nr:hypothetical protein [Algoriphagus boritolerans]SEF92446.1 hypothetical protein SAMN03080598_01892 [Algoriphagus boritolerans DSM 17298 = JCM 18970]